jgi:hypothetical protein
MTDAPDSPLELHEPPAEALKGPRDRIKALMDDPDEVAAAIEELVEEGIARDQIFVLCGPEGAGRLDVYGPHSGLRGRVFRFAEQFGDVAQNRQKSIDHMAAGGTGCRSRRTRRTRSPWLRSSAATAPTT